MHLEKGMLVLVVGFYSRPLEKPMLGADLIGIIVEEKKTKDVCKWDIRTSDPDLIETCFGSRQLIPLAKLSPRDQEILTPEAALVKYLPQVIARLAKLAVLPLREAADTLEGQ